MSIRRVLLPSCVLFAACGAATTEIASDVVVTDSAGVAIVTSSGTDRPLPWTLTELVLIGGEDEGPGSFTRVNTFNVGADGLDRISVLDADAKQLHRFSATGEPLGSVGRAGGGPGEFGFPTGLGVGLDGRRTVFDFGKRALLRWAADDALLAEEKWPAGAGRFPDGRIRLLGDTLLLDTRGGDSLTQRNALTSIIGVDTVDLVTMSSPRPEMQQFRCVAFPMAPLFSPSIRFGAGAGQIAVTREAAYVVELFTAEGRRSVRRDISPTVPVPADAVRLYPAGMKINFSGDGDEASCTTPAEEVAEKAGLAPFIPLVSDVAVAPDGTLWGQRMPFVGEPAVTDVFNAEGRYLGTLADRTLPLGFLSGDRVLFAVEDAESGITRVGVYQLTRTLEAGRT